MQWLKVRWARLCALASLGLTALAQIPYDMGQISLLIPSKYRLYGFLAGGLLFCIFQLVQRQKPKVEETPKPQVIHIHHHYDKGEIT